MPPQSNLISRGEKAIPKDLKEVQREKYEIASRVMSSLQEAIIVSGEPNAAKMIEPLSALILRSLPTNQ